MTLRSLLSFTSGLRKDSFEECILEYEVCAQRLYEASEDWVEPGTTWQYLSGHLQFAGAMAVAASGKSIEELFDSYLYKKFNMTLTSYGPVPWNPSMAGGITSTGQDFEHMLHSLLTYTGLPKHILEEMETDYSKAPVRPSGDGWFGHYGMGHWWECLGYGTPNERAPLPRICTEARIQAGPGEFGYYPLIDRSGGGGAAGPSRPPYYMQVVLAEPDALSGIPEYLRIVVKPVVDIIMSGQDPTMVNRSSILAAGGGLLRRDVDFIESELESCKCSGSTRKGEPYATLEQDQPEDKKDKMRYDLLARGEGLTLFDIEKLQRRIGSCHCEGRHKAARK